MVTEAWPEPDVPGASICDSACCEVRKVEPLEAEARATLDAWLAGLRREQWRSREEHREGGSRTAITAASSVKLNLARGLDAGAACGTTCASTTYRITFFHQGYMLIGCWPCRRLVAPGESAQRAGRWWWPQETDKECGIHCSVGGLAGIGVGSVSERTASEEKGRPDELQAPCVARARGPALRRVSAPRRSARARSRVGRRRRGRRVGRRAERRRSV